MRATANRVFAGLLAALSLLALAPNAPNAEATFCKLQTFESLVSSADTVALATIGGSVPSSSRYAVSAEVNSYLKGTGPERIVIEQFGYDGEVLNPGATRGHYVLFLQRLEDGSLYTSRCYGSMDVTGYTYGQLSALTERVRSALAQETSGATADATPTVGPPPFTGEGTPSKHLDTAVFLIIGIGSLVALTATGAWALRRGASG